VITALLPFHINLLPRFPTAAPHVPHVRACCSIEGPEVNACVQKVLGLAGITSVPQSAIDSTFARVAGPDQKLDKAEFAVLVNELLGRLEGQQ
jgi:hypothetical protein